MKYLFAVALLAAIQMGRYEITGLPYQGGGIFRLDRWTGHITRCYHEVEPNVFVCGP